MITPDIYELMWATADKLAKKECVEKFGAQDLDFIEERREAHLNNMLEITADDDSDAEE
jgi:hypothetical protein